MRKIHKKTFADLIKENKEELLADTKAMEVLEERLELKWLAYDKTGK